MRLLITRPAAAAAKLAGQLEALGHTVLVDPLLTVELLDPPLENLLGVQAIAITSSNALHALARRPRVLTELVAQPLFAVGPATARLARSMGFVRVHEGPGDAAGLASCIRSTLDAGAGPVLYPKGEMTAFDLAGTLGRHGWSVQTAVAYRTIPAQSLLPTTLAILAGSGIDGVILAFGTHRADICSLDHRT